MLPRQSRITYKRTFHTIINTGNFRRWKYGVMWYVPHTSPVWGTHSALGLIVPKVVGNAVQRHACSRVLRDVFECVAADSHSEIAMVIKLRSFAPADALRVSLTPQLKKVFSESTAEPH